MSSQGTYKPFRDTREDAADPLASGVAADKHDFQYPTTSPATASSSASVSPSRQPIILPGGGSPGGGDLEENNPASKYETALKVNIGLLSAFAYALGPLSGIVVLVYETKNDYCRFHAYQSCLIFCTMLIFHVLFIAASSGFQYFFLSIDVALALFFGYNAHARGETLERFEGPFVGDLANRWVLHDSL